uniref:Elongation factor 1-delta n=1 Tax=Mus musculus TaxID=10090 RepID=Q8BW50_MOUSE|nr:unnamed protein product [Mus musculus]
MATNFLAHEKIWFDKFKYDDAERRFYEQMNGPVTSGSRQENGASVILRDIARARENIQKSLAGVSTRGPRTHGLVLGQTACLIGFLRFFFSPFKKATTKTFSTADYFGLWSKLGHKV